MDDDRCTLVKIQEDGIPDGWVVVCCEEHDPLITTWDTADDAKAELERTLGPGLEWWFDDGRWMAQVP